MLSSFLQLSDTGITSTVTENRRQATNYYLGRLDGREPADTALSGQVGGDVADMTDAALAEFCGNYLQGQSIAELRPEGEQDRIPARVESAAVNEVIMRQNPGYEILQNGAQAAMLYKDGIVCVEACEEDEARSRYVGDLPPEQQRVMAGEVDGELDKNGTLSWAETRRRVKLRNIAPENFFDDADWPGWALKGATFAAERIYYPRGDLVALGYTWEQVKDLKEVRIMGASTLSDDVPNRYANRGDTPRPVEDAEQELIEVFVCYVRLPAKGRTLALHKVLMADNTILSKEPADFIPYAKGKIIPFVGRAAGVSLFDRLKSVEDGTSFAYRNMEDNLAFGNLETLVLGSTANVDDAQTRVPGSYIRADVPTDVQSLPHPDLTSQAQAYLAELRTLRSERGGAQLDLANADRQLIKGNVGQDVGLGVLSAAEQRAAWYSSNLANTLLLQVFLLTHETLRRYETDPVGVWVAGQYLQVSGQQFREREGANVRLGMSSGERNRRLRALDANIQMQAQIAQITGPGVLSGLQQLHTALVERDQVAGLEQELWLDPQSPESLQAQQAASQSQQQQQQIAMQMAAAEEQGKQQDRQLDKYKHDSELQWKYYDTQTDAGLKEAEIVADNVTKLTQGAQSGADNQAESGGAGNGAANRSGGGG
jgi:hypothetical protein